MSEPTPSADETPAGVPVKKPSKLPAILGVLVSALVSGGAAFGGAKYGGAHAVIMPPPQEAEHKDDHHDLRKPPGPTLPLEPFLVSIADSSGKAHAMKVTLAIEFEKAAKEEEFKILVPRIRDAMLGYFRGLTFEQAQNAEEMEKAKTVLLEKVRDVGAEESRRILVTDMVVQ